tara:strand:+ start:221 stop:526 length:306 start_codon:yes stop_codon:yes gene_type:complete
MPQLPLTPKVRFVFIVAADTSVDVVFISFLASFLQLVNANAAITAILKITFFILLKFNYCYSITCFTSPLIAIVSPEQGCITFSSILNQYAPLFSINLKYV